MTNRVTQFQQRMTQWGERWQDWLDSMSMRERMLVIFTIIFVVVTVLGSALYSMHRAANVQQQRLSQLKETMLWMQSNAATMKVNQDLQLSLSDKVQRAAQQQSLAVSSQQSGEQMLIQASHQNYAVLANFLTELVKMGLSVEKLELTDQGNEIKLTAAVL